MQYMTYKPSTSLIPRVVFVVDIGEKVMNIMLVIHVLEPCCAISLVCIVCHVEVLKLVTILSNWEYAIPVLS